MLYLSRKHHLKDSMLIVNLFGIEFETMGWKSAQLVLQHGNATPEQLEQFAQDLDSLPRKMTLYSELEDYLAYSLLQQLSTANEYFRKEMLGENSPTTDLTSFFIYLFSSDGFIMPRYIFLMPFDRNIAGKRISEFRQNVLQMSSDSTWNINSVVMKRHLEHKERHLGEIGRKARSAWSLFRVPLIRTRSQLIADYMIDLFTPAFISAELTLAKANTQLELLRLAVALERYKAAQGTYPAALDELVPKYLEEVPLDPYTGRLSWGYKLAPDDETAVLLHSAEWDATGNDASRKNLFVRMAK
jgi:hypothetical protein